MLERLRAALPEGSEELIAEMESALVRFGELEAAAVAGAAEREALVAEREAVVGERDTVLGERDALVAERDTALAAATEHGRRLTDAGARYRVAVLAANPDVPAELVTGEDLDGIDASLTAAKTIVGKVAERVRAEIAAQVVPNGAPGRGGVDVESLSPRDKIAMGLRQRAG